MATIVERKGRPKPWLAQIHRKVNGEPKIYSKSFTLKDDADSWARREEISLENFGRPTTFKEYQRVPVRVLMNKYLEKVSPSKASYVTDKSIITNLLKRDIADKSILLSTQDAATYRDARLETVTPPTVRREINTIQHVFEIARTEWGYTNLANPFRGLKVKGSTSFKRKRRLKDGELDRLLVACQNCKANKHYVSLAIMLAVTTGMRLQEIFNLRWEDVGRLDSPPFNKRRIVIRKSKTDYKTGVLGRTIVMSLQVRAMLVIFLVRKVLNKDGRGDLPEIFPMTKKAFKKSWGLVRTRAGIPDLHFHDLRHEAASRFDEIGLTTPERNLMMGHVSRDIGMDYVHSDHRRIQEKMDQAPLYERFTLELYGLQPGSEAYNEIVKTADLANVIPFAKAG